MEKVAAIIEIVLPVILALTLGMLCRSKKLLSREGIDTLKKVTIDITLPFVLLNAFASAEYSPRTLLQPVTMFILCCVALALGFLAVRLFKIKSHCAPFFATGFEAGMLGYALFALLFPTQSLSRLALLDIGHTVFVFTIFKILLSGKTDLKAIGKDIVTTPILWAVAAGILISVTGLYAKMGSWGILGIFDGATNFLGAPTGMIILLTVGYDLVLKEIPWKNTLFFIAMRLCIMAICFVLAIGLNRTLLKGALFEAGLLLMVILPPPYVIPVFANEPEERVQASAAISALTFVSIILFAVLAVFLGT